MGRHYDQKLKGGCEEWPEDQISRKGIRRALNPSVANGPPGPSGCGSLTCPAGRPPPWRYHDVEQVGGQLSGRWASPVRLRASQRDRWDLPLKNVCARWIWGERKVERSWGGGEMLPCLTNVQPPKEERGKAAGVHLPQPGALQEERPYLREEESNGGS